MIFKLFSKSKPYPNSLIFNSLPSAKIDSGQALWKKEKISNKIKLNSL